MLAFGIAIALGLAAIGVYLLSERTLNAALPVAGASIVVPTDIAAIQHGQHVVGAIALCTECHAANLGGAVIVDDESVRVVAPNLTRGGVGGRLRDTDFARAIRDGVDPNGRALWLMPSDEYHRMSSTDLADVIAYLKSLPPISTSLPGNEIRPLGRLMLVTGQLDLLPAEGIGGAPAPAPAPAPAASPEYGAYLVELAGCARCHGPGLSGGKVPGASAGAVVAANITPAALGSWSEADFFRAMRTGRRPDNSAIDTLMPWPYYAQMSDLELTAIWQFLEVVPARPTGTG